MTSPGSGGAPLLDARALNRALLARQHLLERTTRPAAEVIAQLVGLQTQEPLAAYVGLWSRVRDFVPEDLSSLLRERAAVRIHLMRCTIHLATAADSVFLRRVLQPLITRVFRRSPYLPLLEGVDLAELVQLAETYLVERPRTRPELSALLAERWPTHDPGSLAYAATFLLPLVQIPPRGMWGPAALSQPIWTTLAAWLGPAAPRLAPAHVEGAVADPDAGVLFETVRRYLRAFGPATASDFRAWSGQVAGPSVLARMRSELRIFRGDDGRELFDVPDGLLPDSPLPVPPRFLPEFDNVLVAYAVRTRLISPAHYAWVVSHLGRPPLLLDGMVQGTWSLDAERAVLRVQTFRELSAGERRAVADEGERLLAFAAPGGSPTVELGQVED
jgi:hypothetical protein